MFLTIHIINPLFPGHYPNKIIAQYGVDCKGYWAFVVIEFGYSWLSEISIISLGKSIAICGFCGIIDNEKRV